MRGGWVKSLIGVAIVGVLSNCEPSTEEDLTTPSPLVGAIHAATPQLPDEPHNYSNPPFPDHFQWSSVKALRNDPPENPITDEGATLGRVLFYDRNLSANGKIACGSCHHQARAFATVDRFSTGFEGEHTRRNSMALINLAYYENNRFFWDERASTLEEQVLLPIQDEIEMGMELPDLEVKLSAMDYYPPLFEAAFGSPEITSDRIGMALAQFVRSLVSYRSRYDDGLAELGGEYHLPFPNFSSVENDGKSLFFVSCASCHMESSGANAYNQVIFHVREPFNNGLELDYGSDPGLMETTGDPADAGKFKASSLRNIALTGPYMHDGRFATLHEVVDHYDLGVLPHDNLSAPLRHSGPGGGVRQLHLTEQEKKSLIAFLHTLTDREFVSDERFSDPFRQ